MSANYDSRESTSRAEKPAPPISRKDTHMESGRYTYRQHLSEPTTETGSMSTLTLRAGPSALPPSSLLWHKAGPSTLPPRDRSPPNHNALLPGIQSILPQFFNDSTLEDSGRRSEHLPIFEPPTTSRRPRTPLGYTPSPPTAKRRRSWEEDRDLEARRHAVPRLNRSYHPESPSTYALDNQATFTNTRQRDPASAASPESSSRRGSGFSNGALHWTEMTDSARSSPRNQRHELPAIKTSPIGNTRDFNPSFQTLPSLPPLQHLAVASGPPPSFNEYSFASDSSHLHTYPPSVTTHRAPPPSHSSPFPYGYQQPRGQSYSGPSTYSVSPHVVPYSPGRYPGYSEPSYPYSAAVSSEASSDHKQRKRRGNLPKETTDKLGRWFSANLAHPYPTEDQKQTLMRETGLAMNQISNWFINARRRRLPTLVNNAQAESNLTQARNKVGLPKTDVNPSEYEGGLKGLRRESDGSGSAYDEEYDSRSRLAMQTMPKRGSV